MFHTLSYSVFSVLHNFNYGLMAGVTGQQWILTPPSHLILPSLLSGVHVALHSTLYLFYGDYDHV
jgi:hypothetical protein